TPMLKQDSFRLDASASACESFMSSNMKIVSTVALSPEQKQVIHSAAPGAEVADRRCRTRDEIADLVSHGCDVLLTFMMPNDITSSAKNLRWVQLLSAGADHALAPLKSASFPVTTASGIHATPIAEYTIASMLAFAHRFHLTIRSQLKREWLRSGQFMSSVDELRGRTLGVIGYGSIGREIARIAAALGMPVLALKRDPASREDRGWCSDGLGDREGKIPQQFFGPAQCAAIMRESDCIAVTLPLTDHTRGFVGAQEIAAMRPHAYIVNIGRGEVIDEPALIEALRTNRIGGAGLDVFENEPLADTSPLWNLENVILTPHMSGANRGYMDKACNLFSENLRRFGSNKPLLNVVDPTLGY
ncbi:MAG TPA: D-2-hydroxyacid dehydrogenase, partial [Candidatus Binataceae bacterium]